MAKIFFPEPCYNNIDTYARKFTEYILWAEKNNLQYGEENNWKWIFKDQGFQIIGISLPEDCALAFKLKFSLKD